MEERRKYVRLETCLKVVCSRAAVSDAPAVTVYCRNISAGGMLLPLKEKLISGTKLKLEIYLPGEGRPLKIIAEVVWQQESLVSDTADRYTGLKFIDITSHDMRRLTDYIIDCLRAKAKGYQSSGHVKSNTAQSSIFTKEIRFPGDRSKNIVVPDFLIHEIKIPGDKTRYARIMSNMNIYYRVLNSVSNQSGKSLSQYVSGGDVWLLMEKELNVGAAVELKVDLSDGQPLLVATAEVVIVRGAVRYDDTQAKVYFETNARFTDIAAMDRKRLIRYVYAHRVDYIMLGKNVPPGWMID